VNCAIIELTAARAAHGTSMTIRLKPEYEALIQKDMARGAYRASRSFVERAVQLLTTMRRFFTRAGTLFTSKSGSVSLSWIRAWDVRRSLSDTASGQESRLAGATTAASMSSYVVSPEADEDIFEIAGNGPCAAR